MDNLGEHLHGMLVLLEKVITWLNEIICKPRRKWNSGVKDLSKFKIKKVFNVNLGSRRWALATIH
jgi:hypothetical protein